MYSKQYINNNLIEYICIYRLGNTLPNYIKDEYFSYSHYVRIIATNIRYYDACNQTTVHLRVIMLAYGIASYILTGVLSDLIGGRAEPANKKGESYLTGYIYIYILNMIGYI